MSRVTRLIPVAGLALGACVVATKTTTAPVPAAPAAPAAPAPAPAPTTPPAGGAGRGGLPGGLPAGLAGALGQGGANGQDPQPRPYAQVITNKAVTKSGVFKVHQVGQRLYFEIPKAELDKDFVIVSTLAGTPDEIGIRGTQGGNNIIRFEKRDNRIFVREQSFRDVITDSAASQKRAGELIGVTKILAALTIDAFGADSAPVVEVTRMFTGGVQEYTALGRRATVDASRSYIDRFAAYSRNVNVTAVQTFTPQGGAPGGISIPGIPGLGGGSNPTTEKYTFSVAKLPDVPMQPRLHDDRVGYFAVTQRDFSGATQRVETRQFISRWRLECSDKKVGTLCVPKKPITYYLDPATPAWLKPWIKRGIEAWQPAFEEAGFYKGIVAAEAPANDPDFSGEDATVSMVRWLPSATENAVGPSLKDPRTGEILDADVQTYLNVMNLGRDWYFTQVGPLDKRAQKFPFPDSLAGRLLEYVTSHEVGHTLGFPHNFKASSMYPMDSVRSKTWVKKMGHTPTLMDYARFNYVAQPEDGIALDDLIPKVGPYDKYAVKWGYSPLNAKSTEAEKSTLDAWAKMQDTIPWYRFANDGGAQGADPAEQSEAVGDADAVKATGFGIKNLKRVMGLLESATAWKDGDTYDNLEELYGRTVGQWATELGHVARIVGAEYKQEKVVGQKGTVWRNVEPARQKAAVQFLNDNAFTTPTWLLDQNILRKIEASGSLSRVGGAQGRILSSLVSNDRMERMLEQEAHAANKADVYPVADMLTDLRKGLWKEIDSGAAIDAYRRRLQRLYLEAMASKINPPAQSGAVIQIPAQGGRGGAAPASAADVRPILKSEMRALDADLAAAIGKTGDRMTKAHLEDARDQIKKMLGVKD